MVGADGKVYAVPPNYASKSKLVEGDMLKLTITLSARSSSSDRSDNGVALGVLKTSVTYFRGEANDETSCFVPMNAQVGRGRNIIRKIVGVKKELG